MSLAEKLADEIASVVAAAEAHPGGPEVREGEDTPGLIARYPSLAQVKTRDLTVPSSHGANSARLYEAVGRPKAGLVWIHGGAFIFGHLDQPEANWVGLELAAQGITVLSIDYHKAVSGVTYEVPAEDVFAAWQWAIDNMHELRVTGKSLHLGGASAGGALAASVSLRLKDRREHQPTSSLLVYPMLHSVLPPISAELSDRLIEHGDDPSEAAERVHQLARHYVGDDAKLGDPIAFAGMADDVSGQSPIYVLNADHDSLRASGEAYGQRLAAQGVDAVVDFVPGGPHPFLDNPFSDEGRDGISRIVRWILKD